MDVTKGVVDNVAGDGPGVCPTVDKQEGTGDTPSTEKKKKSRIRIGMGKKCSCLVISPYWLYTGHISASSVIERSASLLLTYGTIYHATCERVIRYTSSKDSLKLIYSKELFTHEH